MKKIVGFSKYAGAFGLGLAFIFDIAGMALNKDSTTLDDIVEKI